MIRFCPGQGRENTNTLAHVVHIMASGGNKRVQFRAPRKLVDRADALATVLGEDRTGVLIDALRDYLRDAGRSDELKQEIAGAYYDHNITFDELKSLVGREEAESFRILKKQLDEEYVESLAQL